MRDANDSPLRLKEIADIADDAREARIDAKYKEILRDMRQTCKSFDEALAALRVNEIDSEHVLASLISSGDADIAVRVIANRMAKKELGYE